MVRSLLLAAFLVCLTFGGMFVYRSWIRPVNIQISRPQAPSSPGRLGTAPPAAAFVLNGNYRLTSVKVVGFAGGSTNETPTPLWHLVSKTGSSPVDRILYGLPIDGMTPALSNRPPQRLLHDETYRLLIEAGKARGQIDFKP
jgi:hypothetical protein